MLRIWCRDTFNALWSETISCRQVPRRVVSGLFPLQQVLLGYLNAAGIRLDEKDAPIVRTAVLRKRQPTKNPMTDNDMLRMLERRTLLRIASTEISYLCVCG